MLRSFCFPALALAVAMLNSAFGQTVDLSKATVVIRAGELPAAEKVAPTILIEEVAKRTGLQWKVTTDWPAKADMVIAISTAASPPAWKSKLGTAADSTPKKPEGFSIAITPTTGGNPTIVAITGADPRGAMFGVGKLLRSLNWKKDAASIGADFKAEEAPDRPLRGHQIGYRDTANSWDAWTFDQYDQYFREMAIFGANAVENIPFQEDKLNPLMKYPRDVMNVKFAELCEKYDLEHWIWVPITFTLPNAAEEAKFLKDQEDFYKKIKRLDAVFVPGGDPGNNKATDLVPYLEKMAELLARTQPQAKIWLSLQHFTNNPKDVEFLYGYLEQKKPTWFGGLVMGPGSPAMELTRRRLPSQYKLRWYPDITHCVRCQYPVAWIDPVLGMTLGREPVNPRPVDYTEIYQWDYTFTDGFLTYSDGVHDDFNKNLWSQLGWNPQTSPRTVARDYARFFFHPSVTESGADGLFALESDTRGPVAENGSIGATYLLWKDMERQVPVAGSPWRFHMHLFRAYYTYYTRNRLLYELNLEQQVLKKLSEAGKAGVAAALKSAREILERATSQKTEPELRKRLDDMAEELFKEVGLQTSVPKYTAAGSERGAVMDFVDTPLNNRWWLEGEFDKIAKLASPEEQLKQIDVIRNWENPGDHGYYDVLGNVGRSPRIIKLLLGGDAMRHEQDIPMPTQRWMGEKKNNLRQSWHSYMDHFPAGIVYNDLDTSGNYIVKLFAQREAPLVIDGVDAKLIKKGETYDQVTEQIFEVPNEASKDGKITLTWKPLDEKHLNWRQRHYVTDIWVMKKPAK